MGLADDDIPLRQSAMLPTAGFPGLDHHRVIADVKPAVRVPAHSMKQRVTIRTTCRNKRAANLLPHKFRRFIVCARWFEQDGSPGMVLDPLIRLVMKSDGVTEQALTALMDQVRQSLAEREGHARPERRPS
jgi:hypothetical protein